jgi:hypothetical protein
MAWTAKTLPNGRLIIPGYQRAAVFVSLKRIRGIANAEAGRFRPESANLSAEA